jgi:hypothetical protein
MPPHRRTRTYPASQGSGRRWGRRAGDAVAGRLDDTSVPEMQAIIENDGATRLY